MQRMQAEYRTVWISDVHLGTRACRAEPLLEFLGSIACEHLYLVGDIIDLENLKRRWYWPTLHDHVLRKIFAHAREGMQVTYIPGNHDALFRTWSGLDFGGIEIRRDALHHMADGRRALILHGDEFDRVVSDHPVLTAVGDWFYDLLLALGRGYDGIRRKFNWPYFSPAAWAKQKVKFIVNVISNFHQELADYARRRSAEIVVTGHIHSPELKPMEELTYANCGDWVENCTALVEHFDGRLQLLEIGREGLASVATQPLLVVNS